MLAPEHLTACILAGGRGRRLGGVVKPLLMVDGLTIFARQRALLTPQVAELLVAIAPGGTRLDPDLRHVEDPVIDAGPLAGIVAALTASTTPWLLAIAGDMPWVAPAVLERLRAGASEQVDAVAPRIGGWPEPLCALWHRRALPALTARLLDGRYKVAAALSALAVAWIDDAELRALDPGLASFANINQPRDL